MSDKKRSIFKTRLRNILAAMATAFVAMLLSRHAFPNPIYGIPIIAAICAWSVTVEQNPLYRAAMVFFATGAFLIPFLLIGDDNITPAFALYAIVLFEAGTAIFGNIYNRTDKELKSTQAALYSEKSISDLSGDLLTASDGSALYSLTLRAIYMVTGCPCIIYTKDEEDSFSAYASYPEGLLLYPAEEALNICATQGIKTGKGSPFFPDCPLAFYPIKGKHSILAVFAMLIGVDMTLGDAQIQMTEHLLLRAGVAMEKLSFIERENKIVMEKELERMRSDFLRSISHDLRTPLTMIIAASSTLEQENVDFEAKESKELVHNIQEEASWLLRMVENLLTITRVGSSGPKLNKSWEAVEEIIAEILKQSSSRFPQAKLKVKGPDDFILIPVDPILIVQVLMNLIDNAVKYAGTEFPIEINVSQSEEYVEFSVRDYGKGLSESDLAHLFEPSIHPGGDSRRSMGLGLAICKSIISSHGGKISGENAEGGGAVFKVSLPKEDL